MKGRWAEHGCFEEATRWRRAARRRTHRRHTHRAPNGAAGRSGCRERQEGVDLTTSRATSAVQARVPHLGRAPVGASIERWVNAIAPFLLTSFSAEQFAGRFPDRSEISSSMRRLTVPAMLSPAQKKNGRDLSG